MNLKTFLLNALIGIVTGIGLLLSLGKSTMCCCAGGPGMLMLAALLGSGLAPLFHGRLLRAGTALWYGTLHGLFLAAVVFGTCAVGLMVLTSDEAVVRGVDRQFGTLTKMIQKAEEQAREQFDAEDLTEEERNQAERQLEMLRQQSDQMNEAAEELKKNPASTRAVVLVMVAISAGIAGLLFGLLGGYLGSVIFRGRLKKSEPPDATDGQAPDRMRMPEQPKGWWEEK